MIEPLRIGDVIEVIQDFDPSVVEVGDRTIHTGARRWYFVTRVPVVCMSPIYDALPTGEILDCKHWSIVDHVTIPKNFSWEDQFKHPAVRPQRKERFLRSRKAFESRVFSLWNRDPRMRTRKELDQLLLDIIRAEPGCLLFKLSYWFFIYAMKYHPLQKGKSDYWIDFALEKSKARLEKAGLICAIDSRLYPIEECW